MVQSYQHKRKILSIDTNNNIDNKKKTNNVNYIYEYDNNNMYLFQSGNNTVTQYPNQNPNQNLNQNQKTPKIQKTQTIMK